MAFKKYFKKQVRRGKAYVKKRYMPRGRVDVVRVAKDVNALRKLINTEKKYVGLSDLVSTPFSTTPYVASCVDIAQGSATTERDGNQVRLQSVHWQGRVRALTTGVSTVRLVMLLDKDANLNTISASNLNQIWTTNGDPNSLRNYEVEFTKRFTILGTRIIKLDSQRPTATFKMYKKLLMHIRFNGTAATSQTNNRIYLIAQSDASAPTDIAMAHSFRTTYVDN